MRPDTQLILGIAFGAALLASLWSGQMAEASARARAANVTQCYIKTGMHRVV